MQETGVEYSQSSARHSRRETEGGGGDGWIADLAKLSKLELGKRVSCPGRKASALASCSSCSLFSAFRNTCS